MSGAQFDKNMSVNLTSLNGLRSKLESVLAWMLINMIWSRSTSLICHLAQKINSRKQDWWGFIFIWFTTSTTFNSIRNINIYISFLVQFKSLSNSLIKLNWDMMIREDDCEESEKSEEISDSLEWAWRKFSHLRLICWVIVVNLKSSQNI